MKKCLIFISLLLISFSGFACENSPLEAYKTKEMVLCVEVGNRGLRSNGTVNALKQSNNIMNV